MSNTTDQRSGLIRRWPLWLLVCAIALLVASPLILRTLAISGLPDAGDPFDVAEFSSLEIPPSQNAFEFYRQASERLVPSYPQYAETYNAVIASGWKAATPELEQWLEANRPALDLFRAGSACPDAIYHQPRDATINTLLPVTQNLREFARMSQLQARRQIAAGDVAGAWDWYRAMLRCSRHSGRHGFIIERLVGAAIHATAVQDIVPWAAHPDVTEAQLRSILEDVRSIDSVTAPPSTSLKVEYILDMNSLANPAMLEGIMDKDRPIEHLLPMRPMNFVMGEPERSRRLTQRFFAELLAVCDLPRPERLKRGTEGQPGVAMIGERMVSAELEQEIRRAPLASQLLPAIGSFTDAVDRERARQLLLETALRLQIYHRQKGNFPRLLDELAADGLGKIPVDPFGTGEPLRYRLEEDPTQGLVLWSLDRDGLDQLGRVKQEGVTEGDIVIQAKPPQRAAPVSPGDP